MRVKEKAGTGTVRSNKCLTSKICKTMNKYIDVTNKVLFEEVEGLRFVQTSLIMNQKT